MKMIQSPHFFSLAAMLLATTPTVAAEQMTVEFSFRGSRGCSSLFPNPELRLHNVPAGTKSILIQFRTGNREMGGQKIALPPKGVVPQDSIRTFGPCAPGVYTYDVIAQSATGETIAKAENSEPFPFMQ
ncbi:hypothetical protein [Bradyrhizobium nitroreducens]|nr:hypothetical protein [Bradyrhizobium nitroreducens]